MGELERVWKEEVLVYIFLLCRNLTEGTEEIHGHFI